MTALSKLAKLGALPPVGLVCPCRPSFLGRSLHRNQPLQRRKLIGNLPVGIILDRGRDRSDVRGDERPRQHRPFDSLAHYT